MASTPASLTLRPVFVADDSKQPLELLAATEGLLLMRQGADNYSILCGELPAKEEDDCRIQNLPPGMIGEYAKLFSFLDKRTLCVVSERITDNVATNKMLIIRAEDERFQAESLVRQEFSLLSGPFIRVAGLEGTADGEIILTTKDRDNRAVTLWRLEPHEATEQEPARVWMHGRYGYMAPLWGEIFSSHCDGRLLAVEYRFPHDRETIHQVVRYIDTRLELTGALPTRLFDERILRVLQTPGAETQALSWARCGEASVLTFDRIDNGFAVRSVYVVHIPLPTMEIERIRESHLIVSGNRLFFHFGRVILMGRLPDVLLSLQEISAAAVWRGLPSDEQMAMLNTRRCSNRQLTLHSMAVEEKGKQPKEN